MVRPIAMLFKIAIFIAAALLPCVHCTDGTYITDDVYISELFSLRIEPRMFNWTFDGLNGQFHYRPALEAHPDLPLWIRYMYSTEYHSGFLYGTPPETTADSRVPIEIIALNRYTYETKRLVLILSVHRKLPPRNAIQMKIDNLNWVHMMDPGRIENLKNIFRNDLWTDSRSDLHIIFMDSATKLGARLPLKPQQREGVVVHLGSRADFSSRMLELQKEVKPLYKIASCTYKRTSVQTTFENSGFKLDWCAFKLLAADDLMTMPLYPTTESNKPVAGAEVAQPERLSDKWETPSKSDVPERNYSDEFAISFAIPGMIFAILLCILTIILCFQHEKLRDDDSEYYFNYLFFICTDFLRMQKSSRQEYRPVQTVQMVQYSDDALQSSIELKATRDPPYEDTVSHRSISPTESYHQEDSPNFSNNYMRPKPPPYKPNPNSNCSTMQRDGFNVM